MQNKLQRNESWGVFDSTKLQEYLTCRRKFFFRYRLSQKGWTPSRESLDLVHGDAIHKGMQQMYLAFAKNGDYQSGYEDAIAAYIKRYIERYPDEEEWFYNSPKNPIGAKECFLQYPAEYKTDNFRLIGTEIYGAIPISESRTIITKLDLIVETNDGIVIVDHKTSKNSLSEIMKTQHEVSFQFASYNLAGLSYVTSKGYPKSAFKGVLVNHIAFKETQKRGLEVEFDRFYVTKTEEQLEKHICLVDSLISEIEANDEKALSCKDTEEPLDCFIQNTKACTDYYRRCEFFDYCHYVTNPLSLMDGGVPAQFALNEWDPRGGIKNEV